MKNPFNIKNKELLKDRSYYESNPRHVLLLPDGMRRFAKEKHITDLKSYQIGQKVCCDFLEVAINEFKMTEVTIFFIRPRCFSDQNRSNDNLRSILVALTEMADDILNNKTKLDMDNVWFNTITLAGHDFMEAPKEILNNPEMVDLWKKYKSVLSKLKNRGPKQIKVNFLVNYSGKAEIESALTTKNFDITNPIGLTIRVGDGMRLSDCPLYALTESHMHLIQKYLPAATKNDFRNALSKYYQTSS